MFDLTSLVPLSAVTDTASQSGNWSSPLTWQSGHAPAAGANVRIPPGIVVTVDTQISTAIHTIRVDGVLQFATAVNTSLWVDTIVVTDGGLYIHGSVAAPIAAGITSLVTFSDGGPIDTTWDPYMVSRGLLATPAASIQIAGQAVTPWLEIVGGLASGATSMTLPSAPTGWAVGDQLIVPGINPTTNQDEIVNISSVSGAVIGFSPPLAYSHVPPLPDLALPVASLKRNVQFTSANTTDPTRQGHLMTMSNIANVQYFSTNYCGRTQAAIPVTDPDGMGGGLGNPRARYAWHWHLAGFQNGPGTCVGGLFLHAPKWGCDVHGSFAYVRDSVSVWCNGAGFVTERGDEVFSYTDCLAGRCVGPAGTITDRQADQDFGWNGCGFWLEGPVGPVNGNRAWGCQYGYVIYSLGLKVPPTTGTQAVFTSANLPPQWQSLANGQPTIPVDSVPLGDWQENIAIACGKAILVEDCLKDPIPTPQAAWSTVGSFTAWACGSEGVLVNYSNRVHLEDLTVIGNIANPTAVDRGYQNIGEPQYTDYRLVGCTIRGFNTGLEPAFWSQQVGSMPGQLIQDCFVDDCHVGLQLDLNFYRSLITVIRIRDLQFGVNVPTKIKMNGSLVGIQVQNVPNVFTYQDYQIQDPIYNWQGVPAQLYFNEQAAGFVPLPSPQPSWVPAQLVGLTNTQLWSQYGLALGGIVAPASAIIIPSGVGLIGPVSTYPPNYQMVSQPNGSTGHQYTLIYLNASGVQVTGPTITLVANWNLITVQIAGAPYTFFVFGIGGQAPVKAAPVQTSAPVPIAPATQPAPLPVSTSTVAEFITTDLETLGTQGGTYKGESGGLYPDGTNATPAAAITAGQAIRPINTRVTVVGIGMSNAQMTFSTLESVIRGRPGGSGNLYLVNAAQGGCDARVWANPASKCWAQIGQMQPFIGKAPPYTEAQVLLVELAEANPAQYGAFPKHAEQFGADLVQTLLNAYKIFPNLRLAYLTSCNHTFEAMGEQPEPYAFEGAFGVRLAIGGKPLPIQVVWGPYLWASSQPRPFDGFSWPQSMVQSDGVHPTPAGAQALANLMEKWFVNDPSSVPWWNGKA